MPAEPSTAAPLARPRFRFGAGFQELGLLGVILVLGIVLTVCGGSIERRVRDPETGKQYIVSTNKFLNVDRLVILAKNTSFVAIMAIGATMVIVIGGIDISVAGIYVLAGLAGAAVLNLLGPTHMANPPPGLVIIPLVMAICMLVGVLCGLINGAGIVGLGLHPFIITLGTMGIFRGLAFVTTQAQTIAGFNPAFVNGFISWKLSLDNEGFIYPVPLIILVLVTVVGSIFLSRSVIGRQLYALGGNELAARYSGLPVGRLKILTFAIAGLTAGIAAMINIGYHGAAASGDGAGYELDVIAAAVVGGASLSGGRGTALGAVLGALIIRLIVDGIEILEFDNNYRQIIVGGVIVAAAALDRWQGQWREARRLAAK